MKLRDAQVIAEMILGTLTPHCDRISVAGSVRRQKPEVKDIEIVCIPKTAPAVGLFGDLSNVERTQGFVDAVRSLGRIIKGNPIDGRYIQVSSPGAVQIDIFTASRDNWGLILAIRTGSADYSHHILAKGWASRGYKAENGMLHNRVGTPIVTPEEKDVFKIAMVPWTEPRQRELAR